LQGAVCIDLPLDHRFEKISISYDGINGQLPNLDLVNTAVSVASGQMGIGTSIQGMQSHDDSYQARLLTMLRGMSNQAIGHGTGAHSVFMPYHIDAITLTAVGEGWQDEMALGRTVESICRSLNNLLEHFHQSFFFYLLMQTNRFVSVGTYLPSAMAVAAGFTIMAIYLWVKSSYLEVEKQRVGDRSNKDAESVPKLMLESEGLLDLPPQQEYKQTDRQLFNVIQFILAIHLSGLIPLFFSNHTVIKSSVCLITPLYILIPPPSPLHDTN
jgi:GPI-anchor transamidase subunit GAA1